jgi:serine phosphatase RsbU (regulator of sigma subunit)
VTLGTDFADLYPREAPFRILIVDDALENVDVLSDCLMLEGYETLAASSGEEALQLWETNHPDLVLLDVVMPDMSGIEVLRRIRRRQKPDHYVPVLLVTALQDLDSKTQGLEAGAEDFIPKPFEPQELIARVRSHLRAKSFHDRMARSNAALREEREKIARMQRSLLPARLPNDPRLELAARYLACDRVGGDFYDAFEISPDLYGLTVADVSGHGAPSAVVMSAVKALLHSRPAELQHDPGATLAWLNGRLNRIVLTDDFITMFYAVLDLNSGQFRYASAGHHPAFLCRGDGTGLIPLQNHNGFPLAIAADNPIDTCDEPLRPGDRVFLYTDGIPEAVDPERQMYSCERMRDLLFRLSQQMPSLDSLANALLTDLQAFCRGTPLRDDVTLLCLEYNGIPSQRENKKSLAGRMT